MGEDEGVFCYADLSAACWANEDNVKYIVYLCD